MIFAVFPPFGLFLGLHNALLGSHSGRTNLSAQFFSKLSLPRGFLEVNDEGRQKSLALLAYAYAKKTYPGAFFTSLIAVQERK